MDQVKNCPIMFRWMSLLLSLLRLVSLKMSKLHDVQPSQGLFSLGCKEKVPAVAYRTPSCHTEGRVVLSAGRPVDHFLRLSHVEPEPDSPAVQLTVLLLRN